MRASRWEVVGAWLRIWTPPRDVEIPPFAWRRALVAAVVLGAVALALALAVIAPAIDDDKRRQATRAAGASAAAERAERTRLTLDQRPRTGRVVAAARLAGAGRRAAARAALLAAVRESVARDARARVASGAFERPIREVMCSYLAGGGGPRARLSCFAVTSRTAEAAVGQPFVAAGSLRDGRYAWCHENPGPGEGAAGAGMHVALSRACTGP
ncbi:MAG TPA: hypothetical protein VGO80_23570 [Solirubrobacteraceae bacterium]|jgi:hypothetical protein|nr:hypothetical protein [Solirubrobacteraceae bacterium]